MEDCRSIQGRPTMRVLAHEWLCIVFNTWWAQLWGGTLDVAKKVNFLQDFNKGFKQKKIADDFLFFAPHGSSCINLLGAVDEFRKHT